MVQACDRARPARRRAARSTRLLSGRIAGFGHGDTHLLFLDAGRFAGEVTQVVQLGAAHPPTAHDLNLGEHRAVHGEDALDADAVRDLPHRERLADAAATTRDADSLERLNALLLALLHAHVHAERVTGAKWGNLTKPLFLGLDKGMHMTLGAEGPGKIGLGDRER